MTFWTNASVLALAGEDDPEQVVTARARALALEAMSEGWEGPPYDPFELAQRLGIRIVPRDDLYDACIRAEGRDMVIEYNPTRPRGRVRYTVAHELAHTLFPDVEERVRFRDADQRTGDDWQLEMLCNIAAGELLMPAGTFPELGREALDIEHLMALRKRWDVSTEAMLLRAATLTDQPATVFAASRVDPEALASPLRIDYSRGSRSWNALLKRGTRIPKGSAAYRCTAVGYSARGADETWRGAGDVHVEVVGLPPYPGQRIPRVAGLIRPATAVSAPVSPRIAYLTGDATDPVPGGTRIIVHVVNDKTANWGGAFARVLRDAYPSAQQDFRQWAEQGHLHLGEVLVTDVEGELHVATIVGQRGYGKTQRPRVRYDAIRKGLARVASAALELSATVHMPRIGAGMAGGSWSIIEELIEGELIARDVAVTVYSLPSDDWDERGPVQTALATGV
jgi:Zn-dependent peptidase ImmA (M78 family)/O-acetyl-ADP-ribose deacetylase (regulator of RNase III)